MKLSLKLPSETRKSEQKVSQFQIPRLSPASGLIKRSTGEVFHNFNTVKILKIGTPEIITIIVLQLEQLDFTVQYCVQKMQTE